MAETVWQDSAHPTHQNGTGECGQKKLTGIRGILMFVMKSEPGQCLMGAVLVSGTPGAFQLVCLVCDGSNV